MFENLKADFHAALERDPAATSKFTVFFTYSGFKSMIHYRFAHALYRKGLRFLPRIVSQRARRKYGIEIHPAATIGKGMFIDHGVGVVIGETAEIGKDCTLYQGVTLGGTGKDTGKRHPTLGDCVMVSAGAKVLGPVTVGDHSKIGAGSVVLKDVPAYATVVGVPGRVVRMHGKRLDGTDLDQKLPDPILEEFARICRRLETLEKCAGIHACKYSISNESTIEEEEK